jgi:hypothetical protein
MKRKLIEGMLASGELSERFVAALLHGRRQADGRLAQALVRAVIGRFRRAGVRQGAARAVYNLLCEAPAGELQDFVKGARLRSASKQRVARAQALLVPALTSGVALGGRQKLGRAGQLAQAQARLRERFKREGRKRLNVWLRPTAVACLDVIKTAQGCKSDAEALELVLEATVRGEILQPKR